MQFLFPLISLLSVVSFVFAVPNPIPGTSDIVVRDPSIWYNPASHKYFVFSTGEGIRIFTSPSLRGPWARVGTVMPNCSQIDHPGRCELWAPSVSFTLGKYVLYYAVSTANSRDSVIGVATSPTMEPGTWTDLGAVLMSKQGDVFNAIDPDLIDYNGLKLSFGSWSSSIYQISISSDVNHASSRTPGTHLAGGNGRPVEGAITFKPDNSSYWFHFFSDGVTHLTSKPLPPGKEYKVLVGRGSGGTGPFYGKFGRALTETSDPPPGSLVLGSHGDVYAPGGQSVFKDPVSGRYVMVYHYIRKNETFDGQSYLGINFLDFSSGWPVVVD